MCIYIYIYIYAIHLNYNVAPVHVATINIVRIAISVTESAHVGETILTDVHVCGSWISYSLAVFVKMWLEQLTFLRQQETKFLGKSDEKGWIEKGKKTAEKNTSHWRPRLKNISLWFYRLRVVSNLMAVSATATSPPKSVIWLVNWSNCTCGTRFSAFLFWNLSNDVSFSNSRFCHKASAQQ